MTTAVAQKTEQPVARPLHVLASLIKKDLEAGREAAERASIPYYQAAGEKMIEAKSQMARGEFEPWVKRNFGIGAQQARLYIGYARTTASIQNDARGSLPSLHEYRMSKGERQTVYPQPWHEPIKQIINDVDVETLNLRQAELKRAEEREAQRQLAMQLIDIGYKALATKLHPDKGGSRDAMARLNQVRDRLRLHA